MLIILCSAADYQAPDLLTSADSSPTNTALISGMVYYSDIQAANQDSMAYELRSLVITMYGLVHILVRY